MSSTHRPFAHLHVHTTFSLLDGISRRSDLIDKAREFGQDALAITEHGNLYNAISFYKDCTKPKDPKLKTIKPILGMEAYVAPDTRFGRDYAKKNDAAEDAKNGDLSMSAYHLTILAKNRVGYENLKTISSLAWREGFYKKPRIDDQLLADHKDGLIVLSGCLAGKIARLIIAENKPRAQEEIEKLQRTFGNDFYLELMSHNLPEDRVVNDALVEFGNKLGIGLVMTGDSHFTNCKDNYAHEIALAIGTNKTIHDANRWKFPGEGYWFKDGDEMEAAADSIGIPHSALDNAVAIANSVQDYEFKLGKPIIPLFKDGGGNTFTDEECDEVLRFQATEGLAYRGFSDNPKYRERLETELALVKKKKFSSYFLIIWDIVNFMYDKGFPVGVGRGSAGGSLLCYCLRITGLDPIELSLPFSRFINEGRNDLPDIDTDISQEHRKEVIEYIVNKYGRDRVAQIVTFQSMSAKAAIDNVGRALGVPSSVRRAVGHLIGDTDKDDKLEDLLKDSGPNHKNKVLEEMEKVPDWVEISERLEGNSRNTGAHAAGITIANEPIINYIPLVKDSEDGFLTTQYDMKDIESLGLLKLDMLGVKTLDLIINTCRLIKRRHGVDIDMQRIPRDDRKTYAMLAEGRYVSVFQYDSAGFRGLLRALAPTDFEHLMAANALYRPGPMMKNSGTGGKTILENYIERRHNREKIELWHESLADVFKSTFGLPLYQEQLMATAQIIAGFTESQADQLRHAIGKKSRAEFDIQMKAFKEGAIPRGHSEKWLDELVAKMQGSARYNWNRSHAAAYSYISYVTAYLEANFPLEYYTELLNVNLDKNDELKIKLSSIIGRGIKLLPPHINHSGEYFHTDGEAVYMGLYSVKQVGEAALPSILKDREVNGPYKDYIDFCIRTSPYQKVTKLTKENLVKAGAFTWDTGLTMKEKIDNTELMQKVIKKFDGKGLSGEEVRAYVLDKIVVEDKDYDVAQKLSLERDVLNFYISSHPVLAYSKLFNLFSDINIIMPSQINEQSPNSRAVVLGVTETREMATTKRGDPYMKVRFGDQMGNHYVNVWSPLATNAYTITADNQLAVFAGTIKEDKFRAGEMQLDVRMVLPIHTMGGLPINSFYAPDVPTANRVAFLLNAPIVHISDEILNVGYSVILRGTGFMKPEHFDELSQFSRVRYSLAL